MENSSEMTPKEPIKIGVIVGAGTGRRLADIFKEFLFKLAEKHGKEIQFIEGLGPEGEPYHSFESLEKKAEGDSERSQVISLAEVGHLIKTMEAWYKEGVRSIFRTSINAETLYQFRQRVKAVKEFKLSTLLSRKILFVRDQAEGFYANTSYSIDEPKGRIHFEGMFTKAHQQQVAAYAVHRAGEVFEDQSFEKWAIYKHHLFGDALQEWIREVDIDIKVYQPDTGLTELHKFFDPLEKSPKPKNLLVICSNEVGDIVYESLINKTVDTDTKLFLYSKNVYLNDPFKGKFGDYQTVHGSADDKVKNEQNSHEEEILPYATFFIAAEIAQSILGISGARSVMMDKAIVSSRRNRVNKTTTIKKAIFTHFQIE